MGISVQPDTAKARISRNVDKMSAQGASDDEIETYLRDVEHLQPVGHSTAHPGNIDLRAQSESTRVAPRSAQGPANNGAEEGVLDAGLNQLTFGLHQKGLGLTSALLDVISHGTGAHPIDTYKASTEGTRQRIAAANQEHPLATKAAEAAGFFAPLAAEAPVRAVMGAQKAYQGGKSAEGLLGALQRIGKNTALGGATGAAVTGVASDSPLKDRPGQMAVGGILGAVMGGGATAAAEAGSGILAGSKKLFRSAETKGAEAARQQVVSRLQAQNLTPEALLENAKLAQQTGAPAVAAHLGGPALDDLSYLGASSMSPSGAGLKGSLEAAQRAERDVLQRGVTAMSGREPLPKNTTASFLNELGENRAAAGAADYPVAYQEPPVSDERILTAIRNDPDLRGALEHSLETIRREDEVARLASGAVPPERVNPLTQPPGASEPTETGRALIKLGVPEEKIRAAGHFTAPADAPELPVKLIDYMKRGVEPVIQQKAAREGLQPHDADLIRAKVQKILGRVDESRPAYQAARARQASYFGREEGAQAGTKAFDKTGSGVAQSLAELIRPGQQEAFRTTATSTLRDLIDAKRYGADVGTSLFDSPEAQSRLDELYGAGARDRFQPYLEQGGTLNRVLKAATGGSQTEPRMAVRAAVKDAAGTDIAATVASNRPLMAKIEKVLTMGHSERVQRALSETLAKELNIPANSPELSQLVDRLYQSIPKGRLAPNMLWRVPSDAVSTGLAARLAAATAAGGQ